MHIVVCIKQVPDSSQIRVHPVTNTIMRQGVPAIVNPYDLFALEEALRLKDCLRRPCHRAVHGAAPGGSRAAQGAFPLVPTTPCWSPTAPLPAPTPWPPRFALASAIRADHKNMAVDIVFSGKQTIDGDTAQVGPGIAKRLGPAVADLCRQHRNRRYSSAGTSSCSGGPRAGCRC